MSAFSAPSRATGSMPDKDALRRRAVQMLEAGTAVFVENQGQWADDPVCFALNGGGANVGLIPATNYLVMAVSLELEQAKAGAAAYDESDNAITIK